MAEVFAVGHEELPYCTVLLILCVLNTISELSRPSHLTQEDVRTELDAHSVPHLPTAVYIPTHRISRGLGGGGGTISVPFLEWSETAYLEAYAAELEQYIWL